MRILITNDDGIGAPGIRHLVEWAKTKGEVVVVAPRVEQSAKSHGIEIHSAFEVKPSEVFSGVRAFSVDSTPADCIRVAKLLLKEEFDIVFSGINRGPNLGCDLVYSATVGAIFEASRFGIPAIAFSTDFDSFDNAVARLDEVYDFFEKHELMKKNSLYNVNIPSCESHGFRITRQGGMYFSDKFGKTERENFYQPEGYCVYEGGQNLREDIDAFKCGYISITPLLSTRTNLALVEKLQKEI
ncbi:MAG: 5'/3'-nucleotidase SurE [Clostridia bacterium]|nr:5'/3'-nucleotidase SurE [Clostridia bacterium]